MIIHQPLRVLWTRQLLRSFIVMFLKPYLKHRRYIHRTSQKVDTRGAPSVLFATLAPKVQDKKGVLRFVKQEYYDYPSTSKGPQDPSTPSEFYCSVFETSLKHRRYIHLWWIHVEHLLRSAVLFATLAPKVQDKITINHDIMEPNVLPSHHFFTSCGGEYYFLFCY